jgi:glycosyltransferase involved in cell wall biosynthesis
MAGTAVSVIIPAWNARDFVGDAVRSVLAQEQEAAECIVVDDGSTDGTAELLQCDFGSDIKIISQGRRGVAAARNAGAEAASGDFLALLDADDAWLPNKLSRQVETLQADPHLDLVYSWVWRTDAALQTRALREAAEPHELIERTIMLNGRVANLAMTGVVRAAQFHELGGFDERLSTSADADLACRLAIAGRIEVVREPLALYRQHGAQMHVNPVALEHDFPIVLRKIYGNPNVKSLPKRTAALAAFHRTLAIAYLRDRRLLAGARHGLQAILRSPRVALTG